MFTPMLCDVSEHTRAALGTANVFAQVSGDGVPFTETVTVMEYALLDKP